MRGSINLQLTDPGAAEEKGCFQPVGMDQVQSLRQLFIKVVPFLAVEDNSRLQLPGTFEVCRP